MKNVTQNLPQKNQNTHHMFNTFFSEIRAIYEIMRKTIVQQDRPQMTI